MIEKQILTNNNWTSGLAETKSLIKNKTSPYHGNNYYKLGIIIDGQSKEEFLFAYPNLVQTEIFRTIERSSYIDKRYLFFCEKKPKHWVLYKWEELTSHKKV